MRTIGIDVDTSSTIGVLLDSEAGIQALASRPNDLVALEADWVEAEPEQWWANVCAVIAELLAAAGPQGGRIGALGISGLLPSLVLLDAGGQLLRRSIQPNDGRSGAEVAALAEACDPAAFVKRTGNGINQQLAAPKLRWLARHEPEMFARIATVCGAADYLAWRLTGERIAERSWTLAAGFLDLGTGRIDPELVALGGIAPAAVPPVRLGHEVAGGLSPAAARATGLPAGMPVIAGCASHIASAFVAGIRAEGDCLLRFSGGGAALMATAQPCPDARLFLDHHLLPGQYVSNGYMACAGAVLNWILEELAQGEVQACELTGEKPHRRLDRLAAALEPGADGLILLPAFLGEMTPNHDGAARGTLLGLGLHHTIGHIWRAALEGVAFGFRQHLDLFAELGRPARRIVASDGGAESRIWMQITADVLGQPVQLLDGHPGACLGAAYAAGMACGAFARWSDIGRFVQPAAVIRPDPARAARYAAHYTLWRECHERLRPLYPRLAAAAAA
jgi:xylulokinase